MPSNPDKSNSRRNVRVPFRRYRSVVLCLAFLLIVLVPVLTSQFHFSFIQGWYQSISIGNLWFVSPLEGLESILTSRMLYGSLLIGMAIPVLVALFLGRVFCAWVCPISFLSEVADSVIRLFRPRRYRRAGIRLPRRLFWASLVAELSLAMVAGVPIFVFLSPPGLVGREIMMFVLFRTLAVEGVIVLAVMVLHLLSPRFFCRYLCPLGALLGVIGAKRRLYVEFDVGSCIKCGMCSRACPLGLDPRQGDTLSAYCWNCGECIDSCTTKALGFRWKPVRVTPISSPVSGDRPVEGAASSEQETFN